MCAAIAAIVVSTVLSSTLTRAASQLLHYDLSWQPNRTVSLRDPSGNLLTAVGPGQQSSIRHGGLVLTLSLHALPSSIPPAPPAVSSRQADRLLAAINRDRTAHGVSALVLDARMSRCSWRHSRRMAQDGFLSHRQYPGDLCASHGIFGQNVGMAKVHQGDVLTLHRIMMAEGPCPDAGCPGTEAEAHGHYMNLVDPVYRRVGIGIFVANGSTWLTEDFTS